MGLKDKIRRAFDPEAEEATKIVPKRTMLRLPLDKLVPNARSKKIAFAVEGIEEIEERFRKTGELEPVVARRMPDGRYQIVTGESRYHAARHLGLSEVPCFVQSDAGKTKKS